MSSQTGQSEELKTLKRIEELLEVIARQQLSPVMAKHLSNPKLKLLYDLTGSDPIGTLIQRTGFSAGTISRTWQKWEDVGLVRKDGKRYRKALP